VCEGDSDAAFIDALLRNRGVPDAAFFVRGEGGYQFFERHLNGVQVSSDRAVLTHLAVVADSDDDPAAQFGIVQAALTAAGFPVPGAPFEIVPGPPFVGVFMMPRSNGAGMPAHGSLETLLATAALAARAGLGGCLDAFAACVNAPGNWTVNRISKRQVNATIAALCVDDPGCSLSYIWGKASNPIPIGSPIFQPLADFLQALRSAGA
jgi:hypothetical protein